MNNAAETALLLSLSAMFVFGVENRRRFSPQCVFSFTAQEPVNHRLCAATVVRSGRKYFLKCGYVLLFLRAPCRDEGTIETSVHARTAVWRVCSHRFSTPLHPVGTVKQGRPSPTAMSHLHPFLFPIPPLPPFLMGVWRY